MTTNTKGKPTLACPVCRSTNWWWREPGEYGCGEWLCNRCHPNPNPVATNNENSLAQPFEGATHE